MMGYWYSWMCLLILHLPYTVWYYPHGLPDYHNPSMMDPTSCNSVISLHETGTGIQPDWRVARLLCFLHKSDESTNTLDSFSCIKYKLIFFMLTTCESRYLTIPSIGQHQLWYTTPFGFVWKYGTPKFSSVVTILPYFPIKIAISYTNHNYQTHSKFHILLVSCYITIVCSIAHIIADYCLLNPIIPNSEWSLAHKSIWIPISWVILFISG